MIELRRAEERHHDQRRHREVWRTFHSPDRADPIALLDPGKHVVHELSPGRSAWLHLVQGE